MDRLTGLRRTVANVDTGGTLGHDPGTATWRTPFSVYDVPTIEALLPA
jgi:hypothetical protein